MKFVLTGDNITLDDLQKIVFDEKIQIELSPLAREKMEVSRKYILTRIEAGDTMYGVNTGFGAFAKVRISNSEITALQKNIIRSHSMGVGEPFSRPQTRAMMILRAQALARGHSGIRSHVVDKILEFVNLGILPVIPSQGSVGASGDLAPLAHLALAVVGEGEVWDPENTTKIVSAAELLKARGLTPLELQAKEGLAMINGCQVMTAVGMLAAYEARDLLWLADIAGALSLEGLRGSRRAFHPLIAPARPHPGEGKTARNLMKILMDSSPVSESHADCDRVQDAYSLRCMPAVHGAAKDTLRNTIRTLEIEANSSTDNPLVFASKNEILSGGTFHGEPVAFAMDFACIAMSALANISSCRIAQMINPTMSGLPAFLAPNGGLHSGHMITQYAAAALVSENKVLSHPASVDSIPTSVDKEDHVSMGTIAARKFEKIVRNAENVLAMEFMCGAQAVGFLEPLNPSGAVLKAYNRIRERVPFAKEDRIFYKEHAEIIKMIKNRTLLLEVLKETGELEW